MGERLVEPPGHLEPGGVVALRDPVIRRELRATLEIPLRPVKIVLPVEAHDADRGLQLAHVVIDRGPSEPDAFCFRSALLLIREPAEALAEHDIGEHRHRGHMARLQRERLLGEDSGEREHALRPVAPLHAAPEQFPRLGDGPIGLALVARS